MKRILWGVAILLAVVMALVPPITQPPLYHQFADTRTLFGIPNAWNVLSNLPFLLVGALGIQASFRNPVPALKGALIVLFSAVTLTAFGSAYYHWAPDSRTLFWDRLPMGIGFMAFLSAVITERVDSRWGSRLLIPLVLFGAWSVVYWSLGDQQGQGDLRPYVLVQGGGLVLVLITLGLFKQKGFRTSALLIAIAWYALAKVLETYDSETQHVLGVVSGHTLKHVAAALGAYWIVLASK